MILELRDINKSFGEKQVLCGVSFAAESGKAFGLLGRNGAGKTTSIRILMDVFPADSGEVLIDSKPIDYNKIGIGYLPEERGLYPKKTIIDQLVYLAQLKGMDRKSATRSIDQWLERLGMTEYRNKRLDTLSKGNQQKIQLITALAHDPDIVILDEPFSGFDPVNAQIIREEILRLKEEGATIILSTHNMESVEELCDNIALINKSHLVISGGVDEIRRKYGNNNVELIYTSSAAIKPVAGVFSVISDVDDSGRHTAVLSLENQSDSNAALKEIISQGVAVNSYKELVPRMNDIFIKLVTEEE